MKFLNRINFIQFIVFVSILLYACNNGPQPIQFGKDNCTSCKMTISDNRFGFELITTKGKCYKFDDMHCLRAFVRSEPLNKSMVKDIYAIDFAGNGNMINVNNALFLQGDEIKSPMGGNVAAFAEQKALDATAVSTHATAIKWDALNVFPN